MNRSILLTAAGLLSAAVAGAGCEQDKTESARAGSARGETMHASQSTGQPGTGAKHGTGTTASGVTTGTATTGVPAASEETTAASSSPDAAASASAAAKDPGATGQAASGRIDEQKTSDAPASASASVSTPAAADAAPPVAGASASVSAPAAADGVPDASAADAANANAAAGAQPAAAADKADKEDHAEHADAWAQVKPAAAAPKEMQVTGTVKFAKADHGVKVMVDLKGLTPNGKHGFHIHEKGDLSDPKLVSAGPHFNPEGKKHGGAEGDERHGGDLGNITADDKGHAKVTIMAHGVTIDDEKTGIVGRSIIVHAKPDDEKTDPSGNSGDRIAGGAIEKKGGDKSADAGTAAPTDAAQPAAAETPAEPQELNK
jgi:Cu-Zn family superoxide dismutase